MMKIGFGAVLVAVVASPVGAQQQQPAASFGELVVAALPSKYMSPECELKDGHFLVGSAKGYLKSGVEAGEPANRTRLFNDSKRVLLEAITQKGQDKNPAAWYYLGRTYLQQGDLAGADSAFARAETAAPGCAADINLYRQTAYAALVNPALDLMKNEKGDSAKVFLREAHRIHPSAPEAAFYLGSVSYNAGQLDSAAVYFANAIEGAGTDTTKAEMRTQAQFYQGLTLLRLERPKEAIPALQAYAAAKPADMDGKKALVNAYRAAGMADSAKVIEDQLIAGGAAGGEALASTDLFSIGVTRFQEKKYAEAADAFTKVLETEPYNRDAMYNLANAYLALKDGPNLVKTATRLIAIEPMSEDVLKLLGEGYKLTKQQDQTVKTVTRLLALPIHVQVDGFASQEAGATLNATATGRAATAASGKAIAPAPVTLVFEFLGRDGAVVATQEVAVPALKAQATHPISITAQGDGIVGWRYKTK